LPAAAKKKVTPPQPHGRKNDGQKNEGNRADGPFSSPEKRNLICCLLIAVAILALYNPVNRHPFVNYDDDRYVTENSHVHNGLTWDTVTWAFVSTEQSNWHPLTWLSHALDYQLFHLNAAGHHFTSLLLHTVNAILLFLLLTWGTGHVGRSFFVAALFAIHPINVESVAWVAERKNVLCTFFLFLTIAAYGWYALKPSWKGYLTVTALFACGLMSKPMVITLPFVLLLLDYWPLGRVEGSPSSPTPQISQKPFSKLLIEKAPLLALSAASAVITMRAQQAGGAMRSTEQFSLGVRLENAAVAYAMYLWKLVWPAQLAPLYPHPGDSLAAWQISLSILVLLAITIAVLKYRSKPYLLTGWLWFLGTLVPVIGLVQVGDAAMADRYAYIPEIGIFVIVTWAAVDLLRAFGKAALMAPAVCILLALGFATNQQLSYWSSNYNLWSHALAVTQNNFIAEDNLGGALVILGRANEACPHFRAAAEINPRDALSHFNMGACLQDGDQFSQAIEQYQATIRLTSDRMLLASTYANQGAAYRELGDDAKARASYDESLRLNPAQFNAYLGLGRLSERQGKLDEAATDFARSVELRPTDDGYFDLGHVLELQHHTQLALAAYQEALKLSPRRQDIQQAVDRLSGQLR
jgi:protein O-mannosyl-transferase